MYRHEDCNTHMTIQQRANGISALFEAYQSSGELAKLEVLLATVDRWGIEDAEIPRLIKTAAEAHNAFIDYQHFLRETNQ